MNFDPFFNDVKKHYKSQKPFVIYKKPNTNKLLGQLQHSINLSKIDFQEKGFLFAPFSNKFHQRIFFKSNEASIIETNTSFDEIYFNEKKIATFKNPEKTQHIKLIDKSLEYLKSGALQKVVLSRKEILTLNTVTPFEYFKRACILYPNTFCYCWYHPNIGMWIGATPETLVKLNINQFETMALAGTLPFKGSENIIWGNKEIEEQQIVVDSILKELNPVTNNLTKGKTSTQKAGGLLHLKTIISGTLNTPEGIEKLIELLHPTSAVCGLPKIEAKKFISDNENYNRKYYTGYLGEINPKGTSNLFVNLRCMELHSKQVSIYVGGGITSLSNSEKEWQETVNKSQIMKQIL